MGRHDWYRATDWNSDIASAFEAKLARSRDPRQYLRIQALCIAPAHPDAALSLLDRYFAYPLGFDASQAHCDRARARLSKDDVDGALESLCSALDREREYPNALSDAYLRFPLLVAAHCKNALFAQAREVLTQGKARLTFPVDHFRWNAAHAMMLRAEGRSREASKYADLALQAAGYDHSGFRRHPTVGLVTDAYSSIIKQLTQLSEA